MATIKSFTDISQSKKLAEILPLESADMLYWMGEYITHSYMEGQHKDEQIPIWSLAALLGVLPAYRFEIFYYKGAHEYNVYAEFDKCHSNIGVGENIVDACYELILKLHKLNLL